MVDEVTTGPAQPYVEVVFRPNEQVRPDAAQIDGAFRVIPRGFMDGAAGGGDTSFKALLLDGSGSMGEDNKRNDAMLGGEQAICRTIGADDYFGIYSFADGATRLFPGKGRPPKGTRENIQAAARAIQRLTAGGATYMSHGIEMVLNDFLSLPDCDEGTVALISDGFNDEKDERNLRAILKRITEYRRQGKILKIQPIAVGSQVSQAQLNRIYEECLADPVQHIKPNTGHDVWAELFGKIFNDLSAKKLRSVEIRLVDKPSTTTLLNLSQQRPTVIDLTGDAVVAKDEQSIFVQTGGWEGDKSRLYSFSLGVRRPSTRDNLLAACLQISYKIGRREYVLDPIPIKVRWTNIVSLSNRIPAELAEARGITGSVEAISQGIAALERNDKATAQKHFQKAYDLAREAKDTAFIRDLGDYMEIDEVTHVVTVKALTREDSNRLDSLSKRRDGDEA